MRDELHYTLTHPNDVATTFDARAPSALVSRYNIAPGQSATVCIATNGARTLVTQRWGLLPRWRGHGGKRGPMVYSAPLDAVGATPLLRDAFEKQRCLVVADGCFAWRELKQPIWFHPEPPRPIAFAGLTATSADDDVASFALLLGPPLATRVATPMPIVISPEHWDAWLDASVDAERAAALCTTTALIGWRADSVSTRMASAMHDDAACIAPLGNPNQGELF